MMIAIRCDRCGEKIAGEPTYRLVAHQRRDGMYATTSLDLCDECAEMFNEWMELKAEEVAGSVFVERFKPRKLQRWETLPPEQSEQICAYVDDCTGDGRCFNCVLCKSPRCTGHEAWEWLHEEVDS